MATAVRHDLATYDHILPLCTWRELAFTGSRLRPEVSPFGVAAGGSTFLTRESLEPDLREEEDVARPIDLAIDQKNPPIPVHHPHLNHEEHRQRQSCGTECVH